MSNHIDSEVTTQNIAGGSTVSLTVDTANAKNVYVFVDDGAGGSPASHDLLHEVRVSDSAGFMQESEATGSTSRFHKFDGIPFESQVTLTNQSGGAADYRLRVVSVRE